MCGESQLNCEKLHSQKSQQNREKLQLNCEKLQPNGFKNQRYSTKLIAIVRKNL